MKKQEDILKTGSSGVEGSYSPKFTEILQKKFQTYFPNGFNALHQWQDDTNFDHPMFLRAVATDMEKTLSWNDFSIRSGFNNISYYKEYKHFIKEGEYIRLRAFNQAYMEFNNIESVTVYRGTDGRTGRQWTGILRESKPKSIPFKDRGLSGYSSDLGIAQEFALGDVDGVVIRKKVPRSHVIVHKDLMSGVTLSHVREKEFIILGGVERVKIEDIAMEGKFFDEGWEK